MTQKWQIQRGQKYFYLVQNIHFHVIFRRKLLEQQNLARMNGGHAPHGTPAGLMPPGGNVMGTPTSGIAQRGLNGMSPAPQQIARPRKILFFFCMFFKRSQHAGAYTFGFFLLLFFYAFANFLFHLLSSVVCFTDSVTNCS